MNTYGTIRQIAKSLGSCSSEESCQGKSDLSELHGGVVIVFEGVYWDEIERELSECRE